MVLYQPQWITSVMINSYREESRHGLFIAVSSGVRVLYTDLYA